MRAAAAQVVLQCVADLQVAGLWVGRQQRHRGHQHAVQAIAALGGLGGDKGALHRVQHAIFGQTVQRGDFAPKHRTHRHHAGARGQTIHQHRAGTAFTQAAAVFGAVAAQVVAQHGQQRRARRHGQAVAAAVDLQHQPWFAHGRVGSVVGSVDRSVVGSVDGCVNCAGRKLTTTGRRAAWLHQPPARPCCPASGSALFQAHRRGR